MMIQDNTSLFILLAIVAVFVALAFIPVEIVVEEEYPEEEII
ncbi:MAG: hypothetical protein NT084_06900 [Bacteroidetes bacterium]|jgi:hypothetical protein|nr:hypothetical protein [Bacteroidota bacterium]